MANNNFPNFFSAPTDKADAEKKASKLISGLNADEKDELQEILGDRENKCGAFLPCRSKNHGKAQRQEKWTSMKFYRLSLPTT